MQEQSNSSQFEEKEGKGMDPTMSVVDLNF